MELRIRQLPVEVTEVNGVYLTVAIKVEDGVIMGPAVLEYRDTPEAEWHPVEVTK